MNLKIIIRKPKIRICLRKCGVNTPCPDYQEISEEHFPSKRLVIEIVSENLHNFATFKSKRSKAVFKRNVHNKGS